MCNERPCCSKTKRCFKLAISLPSPSRAPVDDRAPTSSPPRCPFPIQLRAVRNAADDLATLGTAQSGDPVLPSVADEDGRLSAPDPAIELAYVPGETKLAAGYESRHGIHGRLGRGKRAVNTSGCGHCELGSPQGGKGENGGEGRELHLV
jgi:hypothetical protein